MKVLFCALLPTLLFSASAFAKPETIKSIDAENKLRHAFQSRETDDGVVFLNGKTPEGKNCLLTISGLRKTPSSSDFGVFMISIKIPAPNLSDEQNVNFDLDDNSSPKLVTDIQNQIVMSKEDIHQTQKLVGFGYTTDGNSITGGFVSGVESETKIQDALQLDGENGEVTSVKIRNTRSRHDYTDITCENFSAAKN